MISPFSSNKENLISKIIKSVDQMGLTPQFLIEKKKKYNTVSGGLLSILIYTLSILACFFFGKELYLKQDPTVISSNYFENDPRPFNLTTKNFNFFVGIQGKDYNYYIDPSIYTLKIGVNQITTKTSETTGEVEFEYKYNRMSMEKCNLTKHFDSSFKSLFKDQDLNNLICFDQNKAENLTLAGSFGNQNFQYVEFTVETCKNSTASDTVCKPSSVINEKLQAGFFIVNYIETIFDPKNFTYPNVYIKRNFYTSMSNRFFKEITFSMKNIDYVSDIGILMSSEETKNFIQTDNIKEIYDFREADTIISATFRLSYNRDLVKRRYLKLQDVIAQVGGFIKGITLIISVFNYFYSTTNFYIFLMNKLYFFEPLGLNAQKTFNTFGGKFFVSSKNVIINNNKEGINFNNFNMASQNPRNISEVELTKKKVFSSSEESKNVNVNSVNNNDNNKNTEERKFGNNAFNEKFENIRIANLSKNNLDKSDEKSFAKARAFENENNNEKNSYFNLENKKDISELNGKLNFQENLKLNNNKNFNNQNSNLQMSVSKNSNAFKNQLQPNNKKKFINDDALNLPNENNMNQISSNNNLNLNLQNNNEINFNNKNKNLKAKSTSILNINQDCSFIPDISIENFENVLEKISAKNGEDNQINYNLCEKIMLMFGLCFGFSDRNKWQKEKSSKREKRLVFEKCFEQITKNFDAFKYLKIFDDLKLIKNLIFTEEQVNVIDLFGNMKYKFNLNSEISNLELTNSLKKIGLSSNPVDKKIKQTMFNNQLL
jgi:hypothetical protein